MLEAVLLTVSLGTGSNRVTVAANTSVGTIVAALAGCLALEHLAVLGDAVAVALRNVVLGRDRIALSGRPRQVVTTDLNVVVGEFTKLVVVHAEKLSFLGSAKVQTGNLVDGEGDERADDERVCSAGDDVGKLLVQLLPVVLDPATLDRVDAVETDNILGGENTVEEETDHSSDAVLSEHIEGIINFDPELDYVSLAKNS